jgi:hypothetical protein
MRLNILFGLFMFVVLGFGCSKKLMTSEDPAVKKIIEVTIPSITITAMSEVEVQNCDVDVIRPKYSENDSESAKKLAVFDAQLKTWTVECRKNAMQKACDESDDFISNHIIAASATTSERVNLLKYRIEYNLKSVTNGRTILNKIIALQKYALSIQNSPRGNAYHKATTAYGMAEEISHGNPCITRLLKDHNKVDMLQEEFESEKIEFHSQLNEFFFNAKLCLSCDNKSVKQGCRDMSEPIRDINKILSDLEIVIKTDRNSLKNIL